MDKNMREHNNYEHAVLEKLLEYGYPQNSIVLEAKLDARYYADIVVNDLETGIPLMIIEVKSCSERTHKSVRDLSYKSLIKYHDKTKFPIKAIAAIYDRDKEALEFIDFTEAIKENDIERMVVNYTLPSYNTLTTGAKKKARDNEETEQRKRINVLKIICWGIFPAICFALVLLDAFGLYELSVLRLITIGAGAVAALIPCFKEIKIGELSLKNQIENDKEKKE